jgi:mannonate dehydratase
LGLPRIVSTEADLKDVLDMADSPANGLCYCTGSLSARADNDLEGIIQRFAPRIHAVHLRSVQREERGVFYEADHLGGSVNMAGVIAALLRECVERRGNGEPSLTFRPDHGHTMLEDFSRPAPVCPGYPLIGRLRGLAELRGLQRGVSFMAPQN